MIMVRGLSIAVLIFSVLGLAIGVAVPLSGDYTPSAAVFGSLATASAITLGSALVALAISDQNRST